VPSEARNWVHFIFIGNSAYNGSMRKLKFMRMMNAYTMTARLRFTRSSTFLTLQTILLYQILSFTVAAYGRILTYIFYRILKECQ
jgi:hypothetical protein